MVEKSKSQGFRSANIDETNNFLEQNKAKWIDE